MASGAPASASAPAAPPARPQTVLVDSYPEAAPLISAGVRAFSRVTMHVLESQAASATSELRALEKVTQIASAQYADLAANAPAEVTAFGAQHAAQLAALRPHLETLDALDGVVTSLEESARTLDLQTKQLEAAIGDVLQ